MRFMILWYDFLRQCYVSSTGQGILNDSEPNNLQAKQKSHEALLVSKNAMIHVLFKFLLETNGFVAGEPLGSNERMVLAFASSLFV